MNLAGRTPSSALSASGSRLRQSTLASRPFHHSSLSMSPGSATVLLCCLLFSAVACGRRAAKSAEQPASREALAGSSLPAMDSLPRAGWDETDYGTGLVHFRDWHPAPAYDTIRIWRSPALDTLVAFFIRDVPHESGYSFRVEQTRGGTAAAGNLLEYGYEELGIPLDSLDTTAGRVRVIFGLDNDGASLRGWTRLDPRLAYMEWREQLTSRSVFFLDRSGPPLFHAMPGGPSFTMDLPPDDFDMTPDSVAGDWLRVTVRVPHGCSGEPPARESKAWIRYIDSTTRRPLVWYPTRGC